MGSRWMNTLCFAAAVGIIVVHQVIGADLPEGDSRHPRHARRQPSRIARSSQAARVDALFAPWSRKGMPGAAVLVVQHGQVLLKKGYGFADIQSNKPIRPDTLFLLASNTKPFTALAIMLLADQNLLRYNDRLSTFFPGFPAYAHEVTVRNLLNHTGGFAEFDRLFEKEKLIDDQWPRSINSERSPYEPTSADALKLLSFRKKLESDPGAKFSYSNSGYVLLGEIVEIRSHERYRDFMKREIFRPLGMTHSLVYDESRPALRNRATSYSWIGGKYQEIDYTPLNYVYGEDGIYSTLDDMVHWVKAIDHKKLVKPKTWRLAFTPGQLNDGTYTSYGFGWEIAQDYAWHDGAWLGFRSYIAHHPTAELNVVILSNCAELDAPSLGADVAEIYLGNE
jgi:CubicO group peptidase (beta-lactamase class C family)